MKWIKLTVLVTSAICLNSAFSNLQKKPIYSTALSKAQIQNSMTLFTNQYHMAFEKAKSLSFKSPSHYASLSRFFDTNGERAFVFNPREKKWAAYDKEGYLVASGRANGGASYCADIKRPCQTPSGTHRIYKKGDQSCVSNSYPIDNPGAPMPFCMFFVNGCAIHGSPWVGPQNSSHGCIRVETKAAAWLNQHFISNGTKVVVLPY